MSVEFKKYGPDSFEAFREDFNHAAASDEKDPGARKYIFVMTTEEISFRAADSETYDRKELFEQGLEIRIFDETSEAKWFRASIDCGFSFRLRDDSGMADDSLHVWDESQYLDIDDKKTEKIRAAGQEDMVCATGGGKYSLPINGYKNAKIRIRNYLGEEPDTGELYAEDWRLAGFTEGEV